MKSPKLLADSTRIPLEAGRLWRPRALIGMRLHKHSRDRGFTQHHFSRGKNGAGFTLIEMVLVVSIAAMIASFGLILGVDAYQRSTFRGQQDLLVAALQKARSRALANIGQCNHMVTINEDGYMITAQADDICDLEYVSEELIGVQADITYSGPPDIVFLRVSGEVDIGIEEVTLTLTDVRRNTEASVFVGQNGRISWD